MIRCFNAKYFFPALLLLVTVIICVVNYDLGTFLTGANPLHPEVDFPLNFQRLFSPGVSAPASLADLPRLLLIWFLSGAFPLSALRYLSIFIPFLLGPLGVYFFLLLVIFPAFPSWSRPARHPRLARTLAFLGSLFYLFNLGTVQHFYLVSEMFAFQYGFLPWLFLFAYRLFSPVRRHRDLVIFFCLSFFATPMAYAAQLWSAYFLGLLLFCLGLLFLLRQPFRQKILAASLVLGLTFLANSFWLLPNFSFANFRGTFSFSNDLFNQQKYNFTLASTQDTLFFWQNHLATPFGQIFPVLVAFLAGGGVILVLWRRLRPGVALLPVGLLSLFLLTNPNSVFDVSLAFLRPTWTNFSLLLIFVFCVLAATGLYGLISLLLRRAQPTWWDKIKKPILTALILTLITASFYYGQPMFSGYLISPELRQKIPQAYFDLWRWSQTQPAGGHLALLPAPSLADHLYLDWGYEGAAFVGFGLPQTLAPRDFYHQLRPLLDAHDFASADTLLRQHQVTYLLDDKSVFLPGQDMQTERALLQQLVRTNQYQSVFTADHLTVYQVQASPPATTSQPQALQNLGFVLLALTALSLALSPLFVRQASSSSRVYHQIRRFFAQ